MHFSFPQQKLINFLYADDVPEFNKLTKLPNNRDVEISGLAETYLNKGIIPRIKIDVSLMRLFLRWNFKHLANIKRREGGVIGKHGKWI